ncbi:hypothetical protein B0T24DRAFT_265375 [Lasiosphaeria ovina]|uniref:Uncharacterized protein n=1 Tax=Lasiosphaeria ovina TaxID=92902 RepID=A0AAE0KC82_9PEZI|nr:hypothetical protein B0T24DRAFT_265375 [Lasiosphaeria ovina]
MCVRRRYRAVPACLPAFLPAFLGLGLGKWLFVSHTMLACAGSAGYLFAQWEVAKLPMQESPLLSGKYAASIPNCQHVPEDRPRSGGGCSNYQGAWCSGLASRLRDDAQDMSYSRFI